MASVVVRGGGAATPTRRGLKQSGLLPILCGLISAAPPPRREAQTPRDAARRCVRRLTVIAPGLPPRDVHPRSVQPFTKTRQMNLSPPQALPALDTPAAARPALLSFQVPISARTPLMALLPRSESMPSQRRIDLSRHHRRPSAVPPASQRAHRAPVPAKSLHRISSHSTVCARPAATADSTSRARIGNPAENAVPSSERCGCAAGTGQSEIRHFSSKAECSLRRRLEVAGGTRSGSSTRRTAGVESQRCFEERRSPGKCVHRISSFSTPRKSAKQPAPPPDGRRLRADGRQPLPRANQKVHQGPTDALDRIAYAAGVHGTPDAHFPAYVGRSGAAAPVSGRLHPGTPGKSRQVIAPGSFWCN